MRTRNVMVSIMRHAAYVGGVRGTDATRRYTYRTVVNPAKSVRLACTVARMVRSARDSLVSWSSQDVSEYGWRNTTRGQAQSVHRYANGLTVDMGIDEPGQHRHPAQVDHLIAVRLDVAEGPHVKDASCRLAHSDDLLFYQRRGIRIE